MVTSQILAHVDAGVKRSYYLGVDEFIPQKALQKALADKLDLSVHRDLVPTAPFQFKCLIPSLKSAQVFAKALKAGQEWPHDMPLSLVTYHTGKNEWRIMDGMGRICAAKDAGYVEIPALVASGETFDALESILRLGYYGEDFVEMLAMVSPMVLDTIEHRDHNRMSGK